MKLSNLKLNPNNPRFIKDTKFEQLVISIKNFPEMMEKRPIVCVTDTDGKIYPIGGNMRLKALQEIGYKDIPDNWVVLADDWTIEQRNEFVIKDNVSFGNWDFDVLANEWNAEELTEWGLDIPNFAEGLDVNNMTDDDVDLEQEFDAVGNMSDKQRVVFIFDGESEAESYLNNLNVEYKKQGEAWQVNLCTQSI